jgi:hypothetical protein
LLLTRYSNIDFVYGLSWTDGILLINKAIEKRKEEKDWDMWVAVYPHMDKKSFISFEKFRGKKKIANVAPSKNMSKDEIMKKAEEIKMLHKGNHKGKK